MNIKNNKLDIILGFIGVASIIFVIISNLNLSQQEKEYLSYLNSLNMSNIEELSFYEFIGFKKEIFNKGKLLIDIKDKNKINQFILNYLGDLKLSTERAFGRTYILEIKTENNIINFDVSKSHRKNYIRLYPLGENGKIIPRMNTHFKSYKLYKYFDILEKREKELKNNNGDN